MHLCGEKGELMRLGIDFGGTNLKVGVFSEQGEVISFVDRKLTSFLGNGKLLQNLIDYIKPITEKYSLKNGGLAIKGLVDPEAGCVINDIGAGNLLAGINLQEAFENTLGIEFVIDNDARAYAWGEWLFGAGKGTNPMLCMTLGTGIGSALVLDGKPYQGIDPSSGLLGGHISIDKNGPQCPCGSRGCLELYCSATAFKKRVVKALPELSDRSNILSDFFKEIENGNTEYLPTLQSFQEDLALGIVNIIYAYGPEMVVIGGGVMRSSHLILPKVIELVHKMAWTYPRGSVKIRAAELDNKAAALGIAFHPKFDRENINR